MHWSPVRAAFANSSRHFLAATFAGLVLLLLATAWFDLTFYEAWLIGAKWARFPFLVAVLLPYYLAEETLLGPAQRGKRGRRLATALTLRLITWMAMMGGVLVLHNGEILIGLLALYLAVFNLIQRSGMDIVRTDAQGDPMLPFSARQYLSEKTGEFRRADQQRRASRHARNAAPDRDLFANGAQRNAAGPGARCRLQRAALAGDERRHGCTEATLLRGRRMEGSRFSGSRGRCTQSITPRNTRIAAGRAGDDAGLLRAADERFHHHQIPASV